jgi:heptosyltransferase-2
VHTTRPWRRAQRILFLNHHGVGDAVNAQPALKSLRAAFPTAHLAITVQSEQIHRLIHSVALYDEAMIYRSRKTGLLRDKNSNSQDSLVGLIKFGLELRRKQFDLVVGKSGMNDRLTLLLGKAIGASWIIGECANPRLRRFFSQAVPRRAGMLTCDLNLAILHASGIPVVTRQPFIPLTEAEQRQAKCWLEREFGHSIPPLVLVHPGSAQGRDNKRWLKGCYSSLASWLSKTYGLCCLYAGSEHEEREISEIISQSEVDGHSLVGQFDLRSLAALAAQTQLVVGNDSAVIHIGAAVGVRTVGLYGPTDPAVYGPYGSHTRVVWNQPPCSPCVDWLFWGCGLPICMMELSLQRVQAAVSDLLAQTNDSLRKGS